MTTIHTPWTIAPDPPSAIRNSEHAIQAAFICWVRKAKLIGFELAAVEANYLTHPPAKHRKPVPALDLLFAIPNGGLRGKVVAQQLNLEGVRAGVTDTIFPIPGSFGHILALEFKTPDKRKNTSNEQESFMKGLQDHGGGAFVVCAWREAAFYILRHMLDEGTALKYVPK